MQTILPILRYNDARGAIRSLCATFGFIEVFSVPESGPIVRHAQLGALRTGAIGGCRGQVEHRGAKGSDASHRCGWAGGVFAEALELDAVARRG